MAKKSTPVQCLENTLRYWEEKSAMMEAKISFLNKNKMPLEVGDLYFQKKWREYRHAVLQGDIERIRKEFVPQNNAEIMESPYGDFVMDIPEDLMWWCQSSRRVFHMSHDLELQLRNTKLGDIRWSDIEVPFSSFLLTMDNGLVCGEKSSKAILFTTKPLRGSDICSSTGKVVPEDCISIKVSCFIDDTWENYEPMSAIKRDRMLKQSANGKGELLLKAFESNERQFKDGKTPNGASFLLPMSTLNDAKIKQSVVEIINEGGFSEKEVAGVMKSKEDSPETFGLLEQAFSLIAGFCLYLKVLTPAQHKECVTREKPTRIAGLSAVTQAADICTVQSAWKLTDCERMAFGVATNKGSGFEMSTHFRRGTWRRSPGFGNDPDAPRCIWVRPTIVRPDRLAEGSLPQGALSSVC